MGTQACSPTMRLVGGCSAGFHPVLQAQFSKDFKLVLIIKLVLKGFTELRPLLTR